MNSSRDKRRQLPATPGSPPIGSPTGSSARMDDFENYVVLRPLGDKDNTLLVARRDTSEECIMNIRSAMETSESDMAMFIQEVQLLALLDHRFVLPFVESFVAVDTVHLVTGRFTEDLGDHVRAQRKSREYIKDRAVAHWFTQMSLALDYIHSQNIIHRDFKLESVFLSDSGDVRVGGFGLAVTVASRDDTCDQYAGTPYYVAPEIIKRTPFTQKADVWALGVCLFKLLALVYPFAAADMKRLARSIVHTEHRELPGHVSRHMRELVDMMLQKRPADRPTPRTILRSQPRLGVRAYSFLPAEEFTPIFGADVYARLAQKEKKAAAAAELSSIFENPDRTAGSESFKSAVESHSMIDFNGIGSVTASPPSGTSGQPPLSSSPARPPLHTVGGKRQIARGTMDDMLSHVRPVRSSMSAKEPDPTVPATAVSTTSSHSHHGGDGASGSGGVRRPRAMSGSSARSGNSGIFGPLSNIGSSGHDSVEDEGGLFNTTLSRLDSLMVATTNESRANRARTTSSESRAARRRRNEAARAAERASESTADDERGHEMYHLQSPDRHHGRRGRDNPRRSGSRSPVSDRIDAADPNPVLPVVPAALSSGGGSHSTSGVSGRSGRSGPPGLSGLSERSSARSLRSSLEQAQEGTHGAKKKDKKAKGKKHKKKHKKNKRKSKRSREDAAEAAIANAFGGPP